MWTQRRVLPLSKVLENEEPPPPARDEGLYIKSGPLTAEKVTLVTLRSQLLNVM